VPVDHPRDLVVDLPQGPFDELHGLVVGDAHATDEERGLARLFHQPADLGATTVDHDEVDRGRPQRGDPRVRILHPIGCARQVKKATNAGSGSSRKRQG
jgi:hypothetical protein